jgi:hypothetical protein
MILPFISSLGSAKTLTVLSEVYSEAKRDKAIAKIRFDFFSASFSASASIAAIVFAGCCLG